MNTRIKEYNKSDIQVSESDKANFQTSGNTKIFNEILEARENRAKQQIELIHIYNNTLISFTLNIPGIQKNSDNFIKIHRVGIALLEHKLREKNINLVNKIVSITAAGAEAFLSVAEDANIVKKITVSIEEGHKLGRIFDFDIFDKNCQQIGRTQLGLSARKCLICGEDARICCRSRRHTISELLNKIDRIIYEFERESKNMEVI